MPSARLCSFLPTSRLPLAQLAWWVLVLAVAVLLKAHYRLADENQLQWMLAPLAGLVELLTPYDFIRLEDGIWMNPRYEIAIVKACAGINFMVMAFIVTASHYDPAREGGEGRFHLPSSMKRLALCLLISWAAALLVNSARIVLVMQIQIHHLAVPGLSDGELHRLVGILVFFPALWGLVVLLGKDYPGKGFSKAAMVYLGVMVGVPLVTFGWVQEPVKFLEHVGFVGGAVLLAHLFGLQVGRLRGWKYPKGGRISG